MMQLLRTTPSILTSPDSGRTTHTLSTVPCLYPPTVILWEKIFHTSRRDLAQWPGTGNREQLPM
jgi:hypothetical protein